MKSSPPDVILFAPPGREGFACFSCYQRLSEFPDSLLAQVVKTTRFEVKLNEFQSIPSGVCLDPRCKVRLHLLNSATANDIGRISVPPDYGRESMFCPLKYGGQAPANDSRLWRYITVVSANGNPFSYEGISAAGGLLLRELSIVRHQMMIREIS
jgi:hypothetical protein